MAAIITTMTTMRMIHICIRITEKKRKWYPSTKPLTVQGIKRLGKKSTKEHATQELLVILTHLGISCGSTRFWNNKLFRASSLWSLTWSPLCSKKTFFSLFPFSPKNSDDQGCALAIPGGHWHLNVALGLLQKVGFFFFYPLPVKLKWSLIQQNSRSDAEDIDFEN